MEEETDIKNFETGEEVVTKRNFAASNPVFYAQRFTPFKTVGSIVNYDNTVVNIGNGLDQDAGIFTAPITGIYVFYFSALKNWGTVQMTIRVIHNDKTINSRQASSGERVAGDHWATLETQMTLPMNAGDTVGIMLQSGDIYDKKLPSDYIGRATTFSGFLLQGPMTTGELHSIDFLNEIYIFTVREFIIYITATITSLC